MWKDLLTSYNGQTITYDAIGNPLSYRDGITLTWQNGRELASFAQNGTGVSYTYDISGMRTGKTVTSSAGTSIAYSYVYEDGLLMQMRRGSRILDFSYDAGGNPVSLAYRGSATATPTYYYYALNSRGDVVGLYGATGSLQVIYEYDAYGNPTSIRNSEGIELTGATTIALLNPLRYRGYVYDNETGFYYLQSRYYDPTTCRFISLDEYYDSGVGLTGFNMFAYCINNPIMYSDPCGTCAVHGCYYVPSCTECNPELAALHAERGADWAWIDLINMLPELHFTTDTVSINGSVESSPLVTVTINLENTNSDGESDPNIHIESSYRITSQEAQETILELIIASEYFDSDLLKRSKESWISEWKGHNFAYNLFRGTEWEDNAAHVDMNEEEWFPWEWFW